MIETIYGSRKQVICDNCGDGFEADDFEDARAIMWQAGWQTVRLGDMWMNYCPQCKEKAK